MKKFLAAALLGTAMFTPAFADDTKTDTSNEAVKVQPGTGPTEGINKEVPPMKAPGGDASAETGKSDKHAPTNRVGNEVPPMKPGDAGKTANDGSAPKPDTTQQ